MKKYIVIILFVLLGRNPIFADLPVNNNVVDYTTWDWEDQSETNWRIFMKNYPQGSKWRFTQGPFSGENRGIGLIQDIYNTRNVVTGEAGDWTREKGWRLLTVKLEEEYPYFVLYNIYSGIARAFLYIENISQGTTFTTLACSFYPTDTHYQHFSFGANQLRAIGDSEGNTGDNTSASTITLFMNAVPGQWVAFETPILFDNTSTNKDAAYELVFYACDKYNMKFALTGEAVPLDGSTSFSHKGKLPNNSEFFGKATSINKSISSVDSWFQGINKQIKAIDNSTKKYPEFLKDLSKKLKGVGSIAKLTSIMSGVSSAVSVAATVFDFFSNSSESTKLTSYGISLEGTGEVFILRALSGDRMVVPTSLNSEHSLKPWEYNCAFGLFNLSEVPVVKYQEWPSTTANRLTPVDDVVETRAEGHARTKKMVCHMLDSEVNFNVRSDVEVLDIQTALLVKEFNSTNLIEKLYWDKSSGGNKRYNLVYDYMGMGGMMQIYRYEETETNPANTEAVDGVYEYGTYYMPPQNLKNSGVFAAMVFESKNQYKESPQEISLGVIIRYKYKTDPNSVIRTFKGKFRCKSEQYTGPGYLSLKNIGSFSEIVLTSETNSSIGAPLIIMKEGFVGKPGFVAKPVFSGSISDSKINIFNYDCDNTGIPRLASTRSALIIDDTDEAISLEQEVLAIDKRVSLSPNPTDGILNLSCSDADAVCTVKVYTMAGALVYSNDRLQTGDIIDLTGQARGVYMARIVVNGEVKTEKIILK